MLIYFSDIHGNIYSFIKFLKEVDAIESQHIIFGGDILGYYYHANEIIDELRKRKISCVLGNHDRYFLDLLDGKITEKSLVDKYGNGYRNISELISPVNVKFLRSLPEFLHLELDNRKIAIFHGSPDDLLNGRIYPDTDLTPFADYFCKFDLVLLGHSHHKMLKRIANTTVVNPGSLGQQRDGKGCSYASIDLKNIAVNFNIINYDNSELIRLVKKIDSDKPNNLEVLLRRK